MICPNCNGTDFTPHAVWNGRGFESGQVRCNTCGRIGSPQEQVAPVTVPEPEPEPESPPAQESVPESADAAQEDDAREVAPEPPQEPEPAAEPKRGRGKKADA